MKQILVLDTDEKEAVKKVRDILQEYCEEQCGCRDCPLDPLCTRINNKDKELYVAEIIKRVADALC